MCYLDQVGRLWVCETLYRRGYQETYRHDVSGWNTCLYGMWRTEGVIAFGIECYECTRVIHENDMCVINTQTQLADLLDFPI